MLRHSSRRLSRPPRSRSGRHSQRRLFRIPTRLLRNKRGFRLALRKAIPCARRRNVRTGALSKPQTERILKRERRERHYLTEPSVGYMDVFKLAFETIVVGLLAFVWLGVATYLFSPDFLIDLLSRRIPAYAKDNQTLLGVAVLTLSYFLCSAILPISPQLRNDRH